MTYNVLKYQGKYVEVIDITWRAIRDSKQESLAQKIGNFDLPSSFRYSSDIAQKKH
jgi:hypothetical protein